MGLEALKPAAGDGRGVALGLLLSFALHLIAFVAVAVVGASREMLKPGARLSVAHSQERGKPPVSASIVRVYEESR